MSHEGSVTGWLHQLKDGEEGEHQQQLWNRYFEQLVRVARARLPRDVCRVEDEEDAVLSALDSFFVRMRDGQFPELQDRTSLWPLLVTITIRKTQNLHRRQRAQKRDARRQVTDLGTDEDRNWLDQLAGQDLTPEMAAETAEETRRLLSLLDNKSLRAVALMKLEGYTNREIAEKLRVMERTVERRLALIRQTWTEDADAAPNSEQ